MAGSDCHDEDDDRKDKELEQGVLEPILDEAVEAIFNMRDTPSSLVFDTLKLLLHAIDAPGWSGCVRIVSPALLP